MMCITLISSHEKSVLLCKIGIAFLTHPAFALNIKKLGK